MGLYYIFYYFFFCRVHQEMEVKVARCLSHQAMLPLLLGTESFTIFTLIAVLHMLNHIPSCASLCSLETRDTIALNHSPIQLKFDYKILLNSVYTLFLFYSKYIVRQVCGRFHWFCMCHIQVQFRVFILCCRQIHFTLLLFFPNSIDI